MLIQRNIINKIKIKFIVKKENRLKNNTLNKKRLDININTKKLKSNFEIFNICSSKPIKITKIIEVINLFKIKTKIVQKPLHAADVLRTFGNNSKILKHIKHFKFTDYKEAVKNTVNWFLSNSKLF